LKIPDKITYGALSRFRGTWRRMEYRGLVNGAKIYDDYGHHPTEIKATLRGARESLKNGRLWIIFQPHQYQRTYKLFNQFANAFNDADRVILLPIYSVAGREKGDIKEKVSSKKLVNGIHKLFPERRREILCANSFQRTKDYLKKELRKNDICIIMGAGDAYKLTELLVKGGKAK
ncbi:MAG: UDP-N-acetylmuramate--L-alanine ligase, partial [Candidatus Portnoybacteria bacterium CG09_land_8_20_14_0_10_44_13]